MDIESGTDVTSLHCACAGGHFGIVKLLIERGANVHAKDIHNREYGWCLCVCIYTYTYVCLAGMCLS